MKTRVVFDCMIFLQAAANETGPAGVCVAVAAGRGVELCISTEIRVEIHTVLARPGVRKKFRTLTEERVSTFLAQLDLIAVLVPDVPAAFALERDPKDSN